MPPDRFVLSASHAGQTRDLWRLIRYPARFLIWSGEHPRYHYTSRDGERPHFTALDGLESAPIQPDLAARIQAHEPGGKTKHHRGGWPTRWSDIDDYQPTIGTAFIYPDDFLRFETRPASRRWRRRLVIPLDVGQGVQATHYLAWPTERSRRHLAELGAHPRTVDVQIFSRWDPWSIVHVEVTEPGAEQHTPGPPPAG
jgi:hypothetical protein